MDDRAVGLDRKEPGGGVVEVVDRVLKVLEKRLVAIMFARLVRDRPDRRAFAGDPLERTHADVVPGDGPVAVERRREAQVLARALAGLGRLREPVNGFRDVRRAGEQTFDRLQFARGARARQSAIGLVGIENARLSVGDHQTVRTGVGDCPGRVESRRPRRELQEAESEEQQSEGAAKGQRDDHPGYDRHARRARGQPESKDRSGESERQDSQRRGGSGSVRFGPPGEGAASNSSEDQIPGMHAYASAPSSIAMWPVLARSPTDVSAGERPVGGQRGEGHSFQWDRILL